MAGKNKNNVDVLLVTREQIGIYLFEIAGASKRDGERYVRMQLGDTDYALPAEEAKYLGHLLIQAGTELPTTEFRRGDCEDET